MNYGLFCSKIWFIIYCLCSFAFICFERKCIAIVLSNGVLLCCQAGLELPGLNDSASIAFGVTGVIEVSHYASL